MDAACEFEVRDGCEARISSDYIKVSTVMRLRKAGVGVRIHLGADVGCLSWSGPTGQRSHVDGSARPVIAAVCIWAL